MKIWELPGLIFLRHGFLAWAKKQRWFPQVEIKAKNQRNRALQPCTAVCLYVCVCARTLTV